MQLLGLGELLLARSGWSHIISLMSSGVMHPLIYDLCILCFESTINISAPPSPTLHLHYIIGTNVYTGTAVMIRTVYWQDTHCVQVMPLV